MDFPLWLSNLGSVTLGMTIASVILFMLSSRHGTSDAGESCLVSIIGIIGTGISTLFYVTAMTL